MLNISSKYVFKDNGIRSITSAVARLTAERVRVGVLGGDGLKDHPTSKLKVWQVAALQEFGSQDGHIPERSFIRRTLNDLAWLRYVMSRAAKRVVDGASDARSALDWMGEVIVQAIKMTILAGVPPTNAEVTVGWKGHSHTLIGKTGTMADSVSHDIVSGPGIAPVVTVGPE